MPNLNKKRAVLAAVAVLGIAGAAFAYWSAGGSGTGSGSTASGTSALTANQTTVLAAMYPGDSAQTISGDFNNTNSGPVYVSTVTASIASVTKAAGAPAGTCDATDYTLASATMTVNASVPAGTGQGDPVQQQGNQSGCLQGRDGQPELRDRLGTHGRSRSRQRTGALR